MIVKIVLPTAFLCGIPQPFSSPVAQKERMPDNHFIMPIHLASRSACNYNDQHHYTMEEGR